MKPGGGLARRLGLDPSIHLPTEQRSGEVRNPIILECECFQDDEWQGLVSNPEGQEMSSRVSSSFHGRVAAWFSKPRAFAVSYGTPTAGFGCYPLVQKNEMGERRGDGERGFVT